MLIRGDCLERLKSLDDCSVDSVVTDPPYGLKFMGKKWDYDVPSSLIWVQVLRVLKPGGHLLSFGGSRTYHRMVVAIEDAGFEIRDQVQWLYGSGFPKSHDVSKAIDKQAGAEREVVGIDESRAKRLVNQLDDYTTEAGWSAGNRSATITAPATPDAIKWAGWGSALKPSNEPIVLARKPLDNCTIAENVLKHGTGGLNIDASRIAGQPRTTHAAGNVVTCQAASGHLKGKKPHGPTPAPEGRFPANLILGCACESDIHDEGCAVAMLDAQSGQLSQCGSPKKTTHDKGMFGIGTPGRIYTEKDRGASRFFYCAKSSKSERNAGLEGMPKSLTGTQHEINLPVTGVHGQTGKPNKPMEPQQNFHPTVKPIRLMEYLIRLITPPGGIVLDPFAGSGSTLVAARRLGFEFIGIELNDEYVAIAEKRIEAAI